MKIEIAEKEKAGKDAEERLQNFAKQMLGDAKKFADLEKQLMDQQRTAETSKQRKAESAKEGQGKSRRRWQGRKKEQHAC